MLDNDTLKNNYINELKSNGFNFDIMPKHIQYDQNSDGTVVLENNKPKIIKQFNESAMSLILGSIADNTVSAIKNDMILSDVSDVHGDPKDGDILVRENGKWVSKSFSKHLPIGKTHGGTLGITTDGEIYII